MKKRVEQGAAALQPPHKGNCFDTRLREAEARYRTLVEHLPMVTWIETPDAASPTGFTTTYIGPQIETLLGCSPEEWMGEPSIWRGFLHPADRAPVIHTWDEAVERGGPYEAEYRMLRRDGRIAWVHENAVLVPDEEGRPQFSRLQQRG